MAKPITPVSLSSPGFYGLNTQDSPTDMDQRFALRANNAVIDKYGRIACRKGWSAAHNTLGALGTANVECITEFVSPTGVGTVLAAGNNKLFKLSAGVLSELTYGGGGVAPVITANKWQAATLNNYEVFFQRGHDPLMYDPAASTTTYKRISEKAGYAGTAPKANCVVSAYGRLWAADTDTNGSTVYWTDTMTNHLWTGGTAGSLDLSSVWPSGGDKIMSIAAHNNFLIIFGRRQTLLYSGADMPSSMKLSDHIDNVGCVNRDSVQATGDDILFLSDTGVRSLMRTIQEKSSPTRTVSMSVNDQIQQYIDAGTSSNIISGYSPSDSFYLLTFGDNNMTYCFDMRAALPNGANRVTTWSGITPRAYCYTNDRTLYLGKPGFIGEYGTYKDNGTTFRFSYYTPWIDFGNPTVTCILKKIRVTLIGGQGQTAVFKWGFDYVSPIGSQTVPLGDTLPSEYAISEYAIAEYNVDTQSSIIGVNATGSGRVCQIGFESDITDYPISVQKMDIYIKEGRL